VSHLIRLISCGLEEISTFGDEEEVDDFAERIGDGVEAAGGPFS
jgi:hypothetical protein